MSDPERFKRLLVRIKRTLREHEYIGPSGTDEDVPACMARPRRKRMANPNPLAVITRGTMTTSNKDLIAKAATWERDWGERRTGGLISDLATALEAAEAQIKVAFGTPSEAHAESARLRERLRIVEAERDLQKRRAVDNQELRAEVDRLREANCRLEQWAALAESKMEQTADRLRSIMNRYAWVKVASAANRFAFESTALTQDAYRETVKHLDDTAELIWQEVRPALRRMLVPMRSVPLPKRP